MANVKVSGAVAIIGLDAMMDRVDAGSGNGKLNIYNAETACTFDNSTDTFTSNGHGRSNDDRVKLYGGTPPAGSGPGSARAGSDP